LAAVARAARAPRAGRRRGLAPGHRARPPRRRRRPAPAGRGHRLADRHRPRQPVPHAPRRPARRGPVLRPVRRRPPRRRPRRPAPARAAARATAAALPARALGVNAPRRRLVSPTACGRAAAEIPGATTVTSLGVDVSLGGAVTLPQPKERALLQDLRARARRTL